ncbi:MAG: exopolyphosphatase [Actinomycetaceae bacterium]|nr:exopolyphosphatase [Actinomycetaceae bacterium]
MKNGEFEQYLRTMDIVRLGEGVDRTGRLSDEAIARTLAKAGEYGQVARVAGVNRMRFVATSASRDAENREEFRAGIRRVLGIEPEVVEGLEEAALSFSGAVGSLEDAATPVMVVDIGGGSTEFVLGAGEEIEASVSKNMGSVRITEKFPELSGANPSTEAAAAWVDQILNEVAKEVPLERVNTLVGVAGTVTTITCHALGLKEWDPVAVHGATISLEQMLASCDYMINAPAEELAALAYMPQGRADVISGGAVIWRQILVRAAGANPKLRETRVSEHDILDGIALSLLS